ncbi:hypothetical protein PR202_gb24039 [Eleusine coracana subsp. coracana]|uniref:Uncharacterized protein n=1 Tax=Eleusine coracana subsp. coracana TaxID=191504 RepID=A0AAV5FKH2_ELECO|nr:hypothetical protein PR202_gb24039 [Eleusine coracana subsp. coracana]
MALHQSATTINLFRPPATWRAAAGAVCFFPAKGRRQGGATTSLRLCRAYPDPEGRWWTPQLRPEDLIEPTVNGVEEMKAIRDTLIREPLQPVWLALQEIVATRGNLFRCRCFHTGILS